MKHRGRSAKERNSKQENVTAFISLAIGAALAGAFVVLMVSTPPTFSLRNMVIAQTTGGKTAIPAPYPNQNQNPALSVAHPPVRQPGPEPYEEVGLDQLAAFKFQVTEEMVNVATDAGSARIADQIPPSIKALDEKQVGLRGFMLPLTLHGNKVVEFMMLRSQALCCFGVIPRMNEWVIVRMSGEGVKAALDRPVFVHGKMHVGEIRQDNLLVGIYKLDGNRLEVDRK